MSNQRVWSRFTLQENQCRGEQATPAESAYVRGVVLLRAEAQDNLSSTPVINWDSAMSLTDTDSNPSAVQAPLDTELLGDGVVHVVAEASDQSGNASSATRTLQVDNTPPVLGVDSVGFVEVGSFWWTMDSGPALSGTVADSNPIVSVTATVHNVVHAASVGSDGSWSVVVPKDSLHPSPEDNTVTVRAIDAAGNQALASVDLRWDASPPALSVDSTAVFDERNDTVSLTGTSPHHGHDENGPSVLGGQDCPNVYKHAYLMESSPEGSETPSNPLRWQYQGSDIDGVGVDPNSFAFRVRRQGAGYSGWVPLPATSLVNGSYTHSFDLLRSHLATLGTDKGVFEVQMRAVDLLGQETVVTRCWTHHPLAAPLQVLSAEAVTSGSDSLAELRLDVTNSPVSSLVNGNAGRKLMKFVVVNKTTELVVLAVDPLQPQSATCTKSWRRTGAVTTREVISEPCLQNPGACTTSYPIVSSHQENASLACAENLELSVHVEENVFSNTIPACDDCVAEPTGGFGLGTDPYTKFVLPGKANVGDAPVSYSVFVMVDRISALQASPGIPPDEVIIGDPDAIIPAPAEVNLAYILEGVNLPWNNIQITGNLENTFARCTAKVGAGINATCVERTTYRVYRALTKAGMTADGLGVNLRATPATHTRGQPVLPDDSESLLLFAWPANNVSAELPSPQPAF